MIGTRSKRFLLVAPDIFPKQLLDKYEHVKHVSETATIFPALFEIKPDVIIFDCDYLGNDIEKILRRIKQNKFYNNMKICCYKTSPNFKTDDLLKALGADTIVYREDLLKPQKNKNLASIFGSLVDASIMKWMANVVN